MSRYRLQAARPRFSLLAKVVLPMAAAGMLIAVPAYASSTHVVSGAGANPAAAPPHQPVMIAPVPGIAPRTAARAATASSTCVRYATRAGWASNGYFAGDLVTATAICVAESAGDPNRIVCDKNGSVIGQGDYPGFTCPAGTTSYDRGLWQLNTAVPGAVSDMCAFSPVCNAATAYLASGRGTSFAPWSSYDQDVYPKFIDPAQTAVTQLSSGTVTSAVLGECLVQAKSAVGAKVEIGNCGGGASTQQWIVSGGKLRSGSVCATISSQSAATPGVVLRHCATQAIQQWLVFGRDELRNKADGKCLTDPNGSLKALTQVVVTRCTSAKDQTWWLP